MATPSGATWDVFILEACLAIYASELWEKFRSVGFCLLDFFYPVFMQLYAGYLPTRGVFRLWDILFTELMDPMVKPHGRRALINLAYAIICLMGDSIIQCSTASQIRGLLRGALTEVLQDENKVSEWTQWGAVKLWSSVFLVEVETLFCQWMERWTHFYQLYEVQNIGLQGLLFSRDPLTILDPTTKEVLLERVDGYVTAEDIEQTLLNIFYNFFHKTAGNVNAAVVDAETTGDVQNANPPKDETLFSFAGFFRTIPSDVLSRIASPAQENLISRAMTFFFDQPFVQRVLIAPPPLSSDTPCPIPKYLNMSKRHPPIELSHPSESPMMEERLKEKLDTVEWFPRGIDLSAKLSECIPSWSEDLQVRENNRIPRPIRVFSHQGVGNRISVQEILTSFIVCCHGTVTQKALLLFQVWGEFCPHLGATLPFNHLSSKAATMRLTQSSEPLNNDLLSNLDKGILPAITISIKIICSDDSFTVGQAYVPTLSKFDKGGTKTAVSIDIYATEDKWPSRLQSKQSNMSTSSNEELDYSYSETNDDQTLRFQSSADLESTVMASEESKMPLGMKEMRDMIWKNVNRGRIGRIDAEVLWSPDVGTPHTGIFNLNVERVRFFNYREIQEENELMLTVYCQNAPGSLLEIFCFGQPNADFRRVQTQTSQQSFSKLRTSSNRQFSTTLSSKLSKVLSPEQQDLVDIAKSRGVSFDSLGSSSVALGSFTSQLFGNAGLAQTHIEFNLSCSVRISLPPAICTPSKIGPTHIHMRAIRLLTHYVLNRNLHYCSNLQAICLADSWFSKWQISPAILEAKLTDGMEPPSREEDITRLVVKEWERQISNTGELDFYITPANNDIKAWGLSLPPVWGNTLILRYVRSVSGERVFVSVPVNAAKSRIFVGPKGGAAPVMQFDCEDPEDPSAFYVDKKNFVNNFVTCTVLSEACRQFLSVNYVCWPVPKVQMDVYFPELGDASEVSGVTSMEQSVLLEIWDQNPNPSDAHRLLSRTRTPRFLGECWLPTLKSFVDELNLTTEITLDLCSPPEDNSSCPRLFKFSDPSSSVPSFSSPPGAAKVLPENYLPRGSITIAARMEIPCSELLSAGLQTMGRLRLKLLRGNNLTGPEKSVDPDVYVRVWVKNDLNGYFHQGRGYNPKTKQFETREFTIAEETCNPVWEEEVNLDILLGRVEAKLMAQDNVPWKAICSGVNSYSRSFSNQTTSDPFVLIRSPVDQFLSDMVRVEFRKDQFEDFEIVNHNVKPSNHLVEICLSDTVNDVIFKIQTAVRQLAKADKREGVYVYSKYDGVHVTIQHVLMIFDPPFWAVRKPEANEEEQESSRRFQEFQKESNWKPLDPHCTLRDYANVYGFGSSTIPILKVISPLEIYRDRNPHLNEFVDRMNAQEAMNVTRPWEEHNDEENCFADCLYRHVDDNNSLEWRPALVSIPTEEQMEAHYSATSKSPKNVSKRTAGAGGGGATAPSGMESSASMYAVSFIQSSPKKLLEKDTPHEVEETKEDETEEELQPQQSESVESKGLENSIILPGNEVVLAHRSPVMFSSKQKAIWKLPMFSDFPGIIAELYMQEEPLPLIVNALNSLANERWMEELGGDKQFKPPHITGQMVHRVIKQFQEDRIRNPILQLD